MSSRLTNLPHTLSDDALIAVGKAVIHWSLAEHSLNDIIAWIHYGRPDIAPMPTAKMDVLFKRKAEHCKDLLRKIETQYPWHANIGIDLMQAGKILADKRQIIAHWTPDQPIASPMPPVTFSKQSRWPIFKTEQKKLTISDILEIAADFGEFWTDLHNYIMFLALDGPAAPLTTWHGPKPPTEIRSQVVFRSLQNSRIPLVHPRKHPQA